MKSKRESTRYTYNNRLQPWMIRLGTSSSPSADYCLVYNYFSTWTAPSTCPDPSTVPTTGSSNNGNVMGYWYNDSVQTGFSHTASYYYDNVNRLTQATATGNATYNQIYSYTQGDGSNGQYGNMSCTTGCTPANWSLDAGTNHLLPTSSYTYDAAGNLTKDSSDPNHQHTYQWDAEGRVSSVDSGSTWTFAYNAVGDRVQWVSPGGTDQHMFDPSGGWLGNYGTLDVLRWGDRAYAWYNGSETYFNHVNNINSTSVMTNHAGTAVGDVLFYPWGKDSWHVWGSGGYNFAGMPYYNSNTNTNPTMYRFYTQNLGRWHSPDPLGGDITNPQSLNRYAYVLNNPTSLIDPLGLDPCNGIATVDCNAEQASQSNHGGGGGGGGGSCYLDGVSINCGFAFDLFNSGGACIGDCSTPVGGGYSVVQTAGGPVYVGPNGEELSEGSVAELNLPSLDSGDSFSNFGGNLGGSAAGCSTVLPSGGTRAGFFGNLGIYQGMASNLNTNADFIMAVSSWESGWLGTHAQELHNLFGLTNRGGPNLSFHSYQASADYWSGRVGPFVSNANTMAKFIIGLKNEGYNSNPGYYSNIRNQLKWVRKWEAKCAN